MLAFLSVMSAGLVLKPPCTAISMQALPGDPSLVLHTSASLGDKKVAFMKACSKAIASTLSKPESYVRAQPHPDQAAPNLSLTRTRTSRPDALASESIPPPRY